MNLPALNILYLYNFKMAIISVKVKVRENGYLVEKMKCAVNWLIEMKCAIT